MEAKCVVVKNLLAGKKLIIRVQAACERVHCDCHFPLPAASQAGQFLLELGNNEELPREKHSLIKGEQESCGI